MFSYGIMQGRLTEPKGRGIQFFPFENWREEFFLAKDLGLQEIEWIFDYENYENNPIWTLKGCEELVNIIQQSSVKVNSLCLDYFMRRPFFKHKADEKKTLLLENREMLLNVFEGMVRCGIKLIEIPLVDFSSIKNNQEEHDMCTFLAEMSEIAKTKNIIVGVESDYPPYTFRKFLENVHSSNIVANYDSGNSSGLGYNHQDEILSLKELLYNFHLKDRKLHGTTMQLGTGSANFDIIFSSLKKINYTHNIILQAARGEEGKEVENVKKQLIFVKEYVKKYNL